MEIRTDYPPEILIEKRISIISVFQRLSGLYRASYSNITPEEVFQTAIDELIKKAADLGANAVIGISVQPIASGEIKIEPVILVLGEAVILKDDN